MEIRPEEIIVLKNKSNKLTLKNSFCFSSMSATVNDSSPPELLKTSHFFGITKEQQS